MARCHQYIRIFVHTHKHLWILSYFVFYLAWFRFVEQQNAGFFHLVHVALDDVIPFCEWFVFPYLLWFAYVAFGVLHTALFNKDQFYRLCCFLFIGMTIFLIISTIYPNGQLLRPHYFQHDNIATHLCAWLYSIDTSTNLFPSIHVYNSIAIHTCIMHCEELRKHKSIRIGSLVLCISIILSTMFIKQHSVFDVMTAFLLCTIVYQLVYGQGNVFETWRSRKTNMPRKQTKRA